MVLRRAGAAGLSLVLLLALAACVSRRGGAARRSPAVAPAPAPPSGGAPRGPIYFILVDRFENGDPTNDAGADPKDPLAWHGGDVAGVRRRLPWLEALGVQTLWLSPLTLGRQSSFMGHGAFHGYWLVDPTRPDPRLGTWASIRALRDALHARGMRLILDVVLNHLDYEAPLVRQRPEWFHHRGPIRDWSDPRALVEGDVHGLPDLAVERPDVYAWLRDAVNLWIERVRPDGLRLDAVKHLPIAFWRRLTAHLHQRFGAGFFLLGEDLEGDPFALAARWEAAGFDAVFDFPLRHALVDVACKGVRPARLASLLSQDRAYAHPERLVTLLDNHDLPRIASECGGDPERVALALSLLYRMRGTPSLLYGTEVGLAGTSEAEVRADMRFSNHPLRARLRSLADERRQHPAIARGQTRLLLLDDRSLVLLRVGEDEAVVVALHLGGEPRTFDLRALDPSLPDARLTLAPRSSVARPLTLAAPALRALRGQLGDEGSLERPHAREVLVRVSVADLRPGERVVLCGSDPALGGWDPAKAPALTPGSDGVLRARLRLPVPSVLEWKVVRVGPGGEVRWQGGENHVSVLAAGGPGPRIEATF